MHSLHVFVLLMTLFTVVHRHWLLHKYIRALVQISFVSRKSRIQISKR